ncbi:MAG: FKBP-type peptidyl-prolyl cis-trans isomerase [Aeromonas sp.]
MVNVILVLVVCLSLAFYLITTRRNQRIAQDFLEQAEEFLAQNRRRPEVKTTASGLQYEVLTPGSGSLHPSAQSRVRVHYQGKFIDGKGFDGTIGRGEPLEFALKQVIPGWREGLPLMVEGEVARFFIPAHLAYGEQGSGKIPPGALLIFDVQLLSIH